MDYKQKLLDKLKISVGLTEYEWLCVMGILDAGDPIWENTEVHDGLYYLPEEDKPFLRIKLADPNVVITASDKEGETMAGHHYFGSIDDYEMDFERKIEASIRKADYHFELAKEAAKAGDINNAWVELSCAMELDNNPEYDSFMNELIVLDELLKGKDSWTAIDHDEIDVDELKCGACLGPYHPATGHAFYVKSKFKGVACGICAGRYFAEKMRDKGWRPITALSRRSRNKKLRKQQYQRELQEQIRVANKARVDKKTQDLARALSMSYFGMELD